MAARSLLASPDTLAARQGLLVRGSAVMLLEIASLCLFGPEIADASLMKPRWAAIWASLGRRLEFRETRAQMLARAGQILAAAGVTG